jgi:dihydrofolate reductase
MRKLRLQMQITVDGFVAGPNGELDWMLMDGEGMDMVNEIIDNSSIILMGRKMTPEFTNYWENVVDNQPDSPEFTFAQKMVDTPKLVFSKTVSTIGGRNVTVENGDLVTVVNKLKSQPGKDLLVYGGAGFVSSLIENNLIDEYYLAVNPVAIGKGLRIFNGRTNLEMINAIVYKNGMVLSHMKSA